MRVEGLMRLSFLPAKQLHEARTRGLLTHLHKKNYHKSGKSPPPQ